MPKRATAISSTYSSWIRVIDNPNYRVPTMDNRQAFNARFIRENKDLVLSRGFLDRKDRVSLYLQELDGEYGAERMNEIARTGADPEAIRDSLTIDSTIAVRGNGFFIPIRSEDVRTLGIRKGDDIEVVVTVRQRKRSLNNLTT